MFNTEIRQREREDNSNQRTNNGATPVKSQLALSILFMLAFAPLSAGETPNTTANFTTLRKQALELGQLTDPPAVHESPGFVADGSIKPIFYDGLPWRAKPTRVFAWLGIPEGHNEKVPGIVLVHGGGGTAFKEWVAKWNAHGFAAISIAVEGQTDQTKPNGKRGNRWMSHEWARPGTSRYLRRQRRAAAGSVDLPRPGRHHTCQFVPAVAPRG